AIDVPDICVVPPPFFVDVTDVPGAKMSTHRPQFDDTLWPFHTARLSLWSVAATVIASGVRAGDVVHASTPEFPAATVVGMPAETARCTASSTVDVAPPPMLIVSTAGFFAFCTTQSIPATTVSHGAEPLQSNTRTATTDVPFATP